MITKNPIKCHYYNKELILVHFCIEEMEITNILLREKDRWVKTDKRNVKSSVIFFLSP